MPLSEILSGLRPEGPQYCVDVPEGWTQGRTVFGGLQAALLVAAMRQQVPAEIPLRSLQVTFVGPVLQGTVRIRVQLLRQGKSTVHVQAHTVSDEGVGCTAVAVFGRARPSVLSYTPAYPSVARTPEQCPAAPRIKGLTPDFLNHAEQRWALGAMPFCGGTEPHNQVYIRYPDETAVSESLVLAVADTIPSPAITTLRKLTMASSMTWTLELFVEDLAALPTGYFLMDAQSNAGASGYVAQTATLWSPDRQFIGLSRQTVVVFG